MDECTVTSGFLVEKTFARMCRECLARIERGWPHLLDRSVYSAPRRDVAPEQMPKQYRGVHREPIQAWTEMLRGSGAVEPADAKQYLECYLASLPADWDERLYTYYATEVRALASGD